MKNRKLNKLEMWFNDYPMAFHAIIFLILLAIIVIFVCVLNQGLQKDDEMEATRMAQFQGETNVS